MSERKQQEHKQPGQTSLETLFRPKVVAVIGASRDTHKFGHRVIRQLFVDEFQGTVFPVNPEAEHVLSSRAYASVTDIPLQVDLAIIALPRGRVDQAIQDCAAAGVSVVIVGSTGFHQEDEDGPALLERALVTARRGGVRLIGPDSIGVLNADEAVRLNATLGVPLWPGGRVAVISQAGPAGRTLIRHAQTIGVQVGKFVCIGANADVGASELLEYLGGDDTVDVALLYLSKFEEPRRFPTIARRVARQKPILAVKLAPRRGPLDRVAEDDILGRLTIDLGTLIEQCGVIRCASPEEMLDITLSFSKLPLPAGDRVAILSDTRGPAMATLEATRQLGLQSATFARETTTPLQSLLGGHGAPTNPLALPPEMPPDLLRSAIGHVLEDDAVDAVVVLLTPDSQDALETHAKALAEAHDIRPDKPLLVVVSELAAGGPACARLHALPVPVYHFPEAAVRALSAMNRYRRWLDQPAGDVTHFDVDTERANEVVAGRAAEGGGRLSSPTAERLLRSYAIPVARGRVCRDADDAVAAAEMLRYPIVMKLSHSHLLDVQSIGGVILGPSNELEVRGAFAKLTAIAATQLGEQTPRVLVQEYVRGGIETLVGVRDDPELGPLIFFGQGGSGRDRTAELAYHIAPLSDRDAERLITSAPGLDVIRKDKRSTALLAEILQRVSQMVTELPSIVSLALAPLVVFPEQGRCVAVDARVEVRASSDGDSVSLLDVL